MANIFKINCRKLYETGIYVDKEVEELKLNVIKMKKISEEIKKVWNGKDYNAFHDNFIEYLNSMDVVEKTMLEKSRIMKGAALKHNNIDTDLMNMMDRNRERMWHE